MEPNELASDLFRHESARLLASLTRLLGPRHVALAEDVVQDTLVSALQAWRLGMPDEPRAWLLRTARNKALDLLRRDRRIGRLSAELEAESAVDAALAPEDAPSNLLRMMFSCCADDVSVETHVTLILRYLAGFGPREIASAFLVDVQTIDRRLHRGRARLESLGRLHEVEDEGEVVERLPSVLCALYLLFNEGYHGSEPEHPVRGALCAEAIRLVELLLGTTTSARPEVHALQALFCLHAARLSTRLDAENVLLPLADQDRSRWDRSLIERGITHMAASAEGDLVTRWHVEAGIACEHALATSVESTNWAKIVELYDRLAMLAPGPVVELNRAIAFAELSGPAAGESRLEALADDPKLRSYSFYWAARGDLSRRAGEAERARGHYGKAMELARNDAERRAYERRIASLVSGSDRARSS